MVVILCNGVTLGMYDPYDDNCTSTRCQALEIAETVIYAFFAFEMFVKILAMGFCGPMGYLHCSWNRLDFFIVCARQADRIQFPFPISRTTFQYSTCITACILSIQGWRQELSDGGADSYYEGAKIWLSGYYKCQKSPKKLLFTFRRGASMLRWGL